jgi:hypothetical protein
MRLLLVLLSHEVPAEDFERGLPLALDSGPVTEARGE